MEPPEFVEAIRNIHALSKVDQTLLFGWYLHVHKGLTEFSSSKLKEVFQKASMECPDLSVYLPRLASKKPPQVRRNRDLYRLDEREKRRFDTRYGHAPATVAVTSLLTGLPAQVPDLAERAFLMEALNCYKVKAYRASIVMTWNLAFDHVRRWVLSDPTRLADFNASLQIKYPKKGLTVIKIEQFEDLKEAEIVETLKHSKVTSANIADILGEKLKKRNRVAHPSTVEVTQAQADDVVTDLVLNVVLKLA